MKRIVLLILFLLVSVSVFADQESSFPPYIAETADKKHIFAMLNCDEKNYQNNFPESIYKQCGMYLNDGSNDPLWTVDWTGDIYLPNGGEFIVKRGKWARTSGSYKEKTLSFFSKGVLLKTYTTKDFIDFPWLLLHSYSHYRWEAKSARTLTSKGNGAFSKINNDEGVETNAGIEINEDNKTLKIKTALSDEIVFNLQNGEMISAFRPSRIVFVLFSLFSLLSYILLRRKLPISKLSTFFMSFVFCIAILFVPLLSAVSFFFDDNLSDLPPSYILILSLGIWSFYQLPVYIYSFFGISFVNESSIAINQDLPLLLWALSFWIFCFLIGFILDRLFVRFFSRNSV